MKLIKSVVFWVAVIVAFTQFFLDFVSQKYSAPTEYASLSHVFNDEVDVDENFEDFRLEPTLDKPLEIFDVVRVVDGDTVVVRVDGENETVRLIGLDTPETVHPSKPVECFGIEASNKAKEMLNGKKVGLLSDPLVGERGKYGRLLRYIVLEDGTNFNKFMIEEGYGFE